MIWGQFHSLLQVKLYGLLHSDDDNSALEVVEIHFSSTFDGLLNTIISSMIQLTIYFGFSRKLQDNYAQDTSFHFAKQ